MVIIIQKNEKFESLLQYYRDEPSLNNAGAFIDFPDNNNSFLLGFKQKHVKQVMVVQKCLV